MITDWLNKQVYRIHVDAVWTLDPNPERSRYMSTATGYGLRLNIGEYAVIDNHVYVTAEMFVRVAMHVLTHGCLPRRQRLPWQRDTHDRQIIPGESDAQAFVFSASAPYPPLDKRIEPLRHGKREGYELVVPFDSDSRNRKRPKTKAKTVSICNVGDANHTVTRGYLQLTLNEMLQ